MGENGRCVRRCGAVAVRLRCAGSDGGNPIRTVHDVSAAGACLKFSRGGRGRRGARWRRMDGVLARDWGNR